jgi:hypothetical protein
MKDGIYQIYISNGRNGYRHIGKVFWTNNNAVVCEDHLHYLSHLFHENEDHLKVLNTLYSSGYYSVRHLDDINEGHYPDAIQEHNLEDELVAPKTIENGDKSFELKNGSVSHKGASISEEEVENLLENMKEGE